MGGNTYTYFRRCPFTERRPPTVGGSLLAALLRTGRTRDIGKRPLALKLDETLIAPILDVGAGDVALELLNAPAKFAVLNVELKVSGAVRLFLGPIAQRRLERDAGEHKSQDA